MQAKRIELLYSLADNSKRKKGNQSLCVATRGNALTAEIAFVITCEVPVGCGYDQERHFCNVKSLFLTQKMTI
jgi:hypothetical protein